MKTTHYSYDVFQDALAKSACGASSPKHDYSERDEEVDCPKCLKALGYKVEEKAA